MLVIAKVVTLICSRKTKLFAMLFLRRLPPEVHVQLTEEDNTDLRAMAEKADRCAASLSRHAAESDVVAAVSDTL